MAIYTKTGDKGETSLANCERISKASLRIDTYGTADELNAWIGMLRAQVNVLPKIKEETISHSIEQMLEIVQNKLFNAGAALSKAPGEWIKEEDVLQLESWIDQMQVIVPPMRCFVLPAGSQAIASAHICRTITRRLERQIVRLVEQENDSTDALIQRYINRMSDYLFVLARYIGYLSDIPDVAWSK